MFVLRRITSRQVTTNTVIGESYTLFDAERNPEDYSKFLEVLKVGEDDDVYGFISHNDGNKLIPLYRKSVYFIMMCNGRTFENISNN